MCMCVCVHVSQNDIHDPHSTVREGLMFAAKLRQKEVQSLEQLNATVARIIDTLELNEVCHLRLPLQCLHTVFLA